MSHDLADVDKSTGIELTEVLAAFTRLRRENDLLVAAIARDHGLHAPDFRAVAFVRTTPDLTPRGLAEYLALSLSATTAVIDRLVASGYVLRTPNPEDGRSVRLEVTQEGADAVEDALEIYTAAFNISVPADRREDVAATFIDIADALAEVAVARTASARA
ncbi:MarR family transcriptional regulator [Pseudolysinimonas sp.]|uniref:MarR family winged helix-turn-helix transcriptional regulator n=1 Tax=Pseudolysinimonas sp. TaxID=2680009 RepID=UPI00286C7DFA|nr:MarR family transcriptional regulator [Pseudolysinimonas sp.]